MNVKQFISKMGDKFVKDETSTLAASLAYYTALSLAPLVILFVTVSSQFSESLQKRFVVQVQGLMGTEAARSIENIINGAQNREDLSTMAGLIGVFTLLLSASLIFGELRA